MVSTNSQLLTKAKAEGRTPRPANCFMLFRSDFTKTFNTTGPDQGAASVIAGEIWRDMPEEEKRPWRELENTVKAEHKLAHPNYRFQRKPKQKVTRKKGKQEEEDNVQTERYFVVKALEVDKNGDNIRTITPAVSQMLKQEVALNPQFGMGDKAMEDKPASEWNGIVNPFWTWPTAPRMNDCSPDIADWKRSPAPTFSIVEPGPRSDVYPPARAIRRAIAKQ